MREVFTKSQKCVDNILDLKNAKILAHQYNKNKIDIIKITN